MTARLRVFDPPMCCSTGVCGPTVDPDLVRFARDLAWLRHHDVEVERYNLAQEPDAFVKNAAVLAVLNDQGAERLPIVIVDGEILEETGYPSRERLLELVGLREGD
jgi:hypothetical protein